MPKVSVVIPTYNAGKYLRQCLDSVTSQSLQDIEIICVNDGSTDDSLSIAEEYAQKDSRVKVISKPNAGYGHSMNVGLDAATGEYLGIVDADDYVLQGMYETLYHYANMDNLDFIRGGYYKFYEIDGTEKRTYWGSMGAKYMDVVYCPRQTSDFYLSAVLTPGGIYKMDFLRSNNIRYNETPSAAFQDHGFWFKTHLLADRVLFIHDAFYMYRFDNPNSSIYKKTSVEIMNNEYDYIKEFVDAHPELSYIATPFYWKARFLNCKITYSRLVRLIGQRTVAQLAAPFIESQKKGTLDFSLFTGTQLKSLNLLIDNPKLFCKALKIETSHALYREHIDRDLRGVKKGFFYQFIWYCKRFGTPYALYMASRKFFILLSQKFKSAGKKFAICYERFHTKTSPAYAKRKKTIDQMSTYLVAQRDLNYRNDQMFWWSINQAGETLTETKRKFFLNMPKAEGTLRLRQEEYIAVLEELKSLLDKNGLCFWPMGGTMVGMLRHKGFIPWDDDIDISMMYEDKEKLFELVENSTTLKIEEVYWCGNTVLRCPRVTFKDTSNTGLVDIFLWERANTEPTGFKPLWSKRNRFASLMNAKYRTIKPILHHVYNGESISDPHDKDLLESIFEEYRAECLAACGTGGTTIYGSIDMWFQAGKWLAVYDTHAVFPMREAEFEGVTYKIPHAAEAFLFDQYGDWMALPNKVKPSHGG